MMNWLRLMAFLNAVGALALTVKLVLFQGDLSDLACVTLNGVVVLLVAIIDK